MSTLVAIPVYERKQYVKRCFMTLAEMALPMNSRIVVFDDCSRTFDPAELAAEVGLGAIVQRQPFRLGADAMTYLIWSAFLESGEDYLLVIDSDMIANRLTLTDGLPLRQRFNGLLSLYNSRRHPPSAQSDEIVMKERLGNAGSFWNRELVTLVRDNLKVGNFLDDRYCQFLADKGIQLASTIRSRLQHLGFQGENNRFYGDLEHGIGFVPDSVIQSEALLDAYDELMMMQPSLLPYKKPNSFKKQL